MKALTKVAERQNITLSCPVFGAPKPTMKWLKKIQNGKYMDVLDDPRSKILPNGDLFVQVRLDVKTRGTAIKNLSTLVCMQSVRCLSFKSQ